MLTSFTTSKIAPEHQLDAWNDCMAQTYSGLSASPMRAGFAARVTRWQLGQAILSRPVSTPVAVERRYQSAHQPVNRTLKLHVVQTGRGRLSHRRRESFLRQGDIVVCAGEENYRFEMVEDHELLIAELNFSMFREPVAWLDDIIGQVIPRRSPSTRLIHDFLLSLWRQSDTLEGDDTQDALGRLLADMVLAGLRARPEPDGVVHAPLWQRCKAVVAERQGDSALTPASLADELGVSLRTLQAAAAVRGTTPGAYIAEKRLALAQQCLLQHTHRSVTQIAFDCGFEDSGYFSRRFRQNFGLSPAQYRQRNGT